MVPNDYALVREAIDRGVPLDEVKPGNKITAQLKKLVLAQAAAKPAADAKPGRSCRSSSCRWRNNARGRRHAHPLQQQQAINNGRPFHSPARRRARSRRPSTSRRRGAAKAWPGRCFRRARAEPAPPAQPAANPLLSDKLLDAKVRLHRRLIEEINLSALEKLPEEEIRKHVQQLVSQYVLVERLALNTQELDEFVSEILDEMTALGRSSRCSRTRASTTS